MIDQLSDTLHAERGPSVTVERSMHTSAGFRRSGDATGQEPYWLATSVRCMVGPPVNALDQDRLEGLDLEKE